MVETWTLIPGENISTWAESKWARGVAHLNELQARIGEWGATRPLRTLARIGDDQHCIEFHLDIVDAPPLQEFAVILGDALHNFRSALDAITWSMATYHGAEPKQPRRVQFPITLTEDSWDRWVAVTETIPDELRSRIRSVQPFENQIEGGINALEVLHDLDIIDKHREAIVVQLAPREIQVVGMQIYFAMAGTTLTWEYPQSIAFEQDALVAVLRISAEAPPIPSDSSLGSGAIQADFAVPYDDELIKFSDLANVLTPGVANLLQTLYGNLQDPAGASS